MKKLLSGVMFLFLLMGVVYAQEEEFTPPQEAIDACSGKEERNSCQVSTPTGIKHGVCVNTPDKKYVTCVPFELKVAIPDVDIK